MDPELDLEAGLNYLCHVKSFLTIVFAIGNIAIWGSHGPNHPLDPPLHGSKLVSVMNRVAKVNKVKIFLLSSVELKHHQKYLYKDCKPF